MDIQGAEVAQPYIKEAGVTYTALIDENNLLGKLFGVNYVPLHYVIDEFGIYQMKERNPDIIAEFLDKNKVDRDLFKETSKSRDIYNIPTLSEMAKHQPDNVSIRLMLGDLLIQKKKYEEGIKEYKKVIELKPNSAEGYFRLGRTMLEIGRKEQALVELKNALEFDPDNWIIRKQIWAIKNPDKFYSGNVDYDWQKIQLEKGN
ncbi:tetratricopeptide repeat protein [Candidatus Poribacteria bacterium]|nr:tetratricopeptide repeat protein [Candidatus Poribacteria bacterium]